jgi:hypothetical protein
VLRDGLVSSDERKDKFVNRVVGGGLGH